MTITIRNQREAFLYTVRIECAEGWCEARNLSHSVALAYVAQQQTPLAGDSDTESKDGK